MLNERRFFYQIKMTEKLKTTVKMYEFEDEDEKSWYCNGKKFFKKNGLNRVYGTFKGLLLVTESYDSLNDMKIKMIETHIHFWCNDKVYWYENLLIEMDMKTDHIKTRIELEANGDWDRYKKHCVAQIKGAKRLKEKYLNAIDKLKEGK